MAGSTKSTTKRLANFMKARFETGQPPYNFFFGAGASVPSTYPTAKGFVDSFLQHAAVDPSGMSDAEKRAEFDNQWRSAGEANTKAFIMRTLPPAVPSTGYTLLAGLVRSYYASKIITTNVDTLVDQALSGDPQGFQLLSHPLYPPRKIADGLNSTLPRIKVLKLHGDLPSGTFLFTEKELRAFPGELARALTSILQRDTVFCGYGFNDEDVRKCLKKTRGTPGPSVFCVSPELPDVGATSLLEAYASGLQTITGTGADFDEFMRELTEELGLYDLKLWTTFDSKFDQSSLEGISVFAGPAGPSPGISCLEP